MEVDFRHIDGEIVGVTVDENGNEQLAGIKGGSFSMGQGTVETPASGANDIPQFDQLKTVVSRGKVFADDGELYDHPNDAEEAATDFIQLGPGTFESFGISTPGLAVRGSGSGTLVDGESGGAINIGADNVTVADLDVTHLLEGDDRTLIYGDSSVGSTLRNVTIRQSDGRAVWSGESWDIVGCTFESSSNSAVYLPHVKTKVVRCTFGSGVHEGIDADLGPSNNNSFINNFFDNVQNSSIMAGGINDIVIGNICLNSGFTAIYSTEANQMVGSNRATGADGVIKVYGTDDIIFNNRVTSIDTASATTPELDSNITG